MTIDNQNTRWEYDGDAVTADFPYDNLVVSKSDLTVYVDGTLKTLVTDYDVTGVGELTGGNVHFAAGHIPADGTKNVIIVSAIPNKQGFSLKSITSLASSSFNLALDKIVRLIQQLDVRIDRALRQADNDTGALGPLPLLAIRMGKLLGFDLDGNPTVTNTTIAEFDVIVDTANDAAAAAALAATQAEALASAALTSATLAAASAATATSVLAAAEAVAANALWNDVVFVTAAMSPYAIGATGGTMYAVDATAGPVTLNLPSIAALNLAVPWALGAMKTDVSANTVTLARNGADTINGGASLILTSRNQGATLIPDTDPVPDTWTAMMVGASSEDFVVDVFSGDDVTVDFTLSRAPGNKNNTDVYINGVHQDHSTYDVVNVTLTFTLAPPGGLDNVEVKVGSALSVGVPGAGSVGGTQINAGDAAAIRTALALGALAVKNTVDTPQIDNAAVTFAKMQSASTVCLLGATGANPFQQLGIGTGLALDTGTGVLTSNGLGTSSVGQAQLKTAFNEASVFVSSLSSATLDFVTAGGEYGFALVWKSVTTAFGGVGLTPTLSNQCPTDVAFAQYIHVDVASGGPGSEGVGTIRQRYISASPPYDLGEGEIASFIFVTIERGTGKPVGLWAAEDPPWAYNGPTRTRGNAFKGVKSDTLYGSVFDAIAAKEDVVPVIARRTRETLAAARAAGRLRQYLEQLREGELWYEPVTMAMKMADMAVIPHPFAGLDRTKHVVALLDPMLPLTQRLTHLMRHADEAGASVADLVFGGDVKIDNVDLVASRRRKAPPGVMLVRADLR